MIWHILLLGILCFMLFCSFIQWLVLTLRSNDLKRRLHEAQQKDNKCPKCGAKTIEGLCTGMRRDDEDS